MNFIKSRIELFKKMSKKEKTKVIMLWIIRIVMITFVTYSIVELALGHTEVEGRLANINITGIIQATTLFALTFVPRIIEKIWKIKLPFFIVTLFLFFCVSSLFLGEIFDFYIKYDWWDDVLHTFSGFYIAAIGFFIINILNERRDIAMKLSPGFVAIYAFILSLACECVWEIFEFAADKFVHSNMQRAYESTSFKEHGAVNDIADPNFNALVGTDALTDTMGDIIEVFIGALILCVIGYIVLKHSKSIKDKIKRILAFKKSEVIDSVDKNIDENNNENDI